MEDFRVFGSPVFVLDKKLQDGDSLAKWKACSWLVVYIGHSLVHSGNFPVIYNPQQHIFHQSFMWSSTTSLQRLQATPVSSRMTILNVLHRIPKLLIFIIHLTTSEVISRVKIFGTRQCSGVNSE
jgi:hypothetical protein